jgi:hypothetical protein
MRIKRRDAACFLIHHNYKVPYDILGVPCYRVHIVHDNTDMLQRLVEIVSSLGERLLTAVSQTADFARMKIVNFRPDMLIIKASLLMPAVRGLVGEEEFRALRIISVGRPDAEGALLCEDWFEEEAEVGSVCKKFAALLPHD